MNIMKVSNDKKAYIDLLLLADEQENMIDKYIEEQVKKSIDVKQQLFEDKNLMNLINIMP